jgi:hypothetical protein
VRPSSILSPFLHPSPSASIRGSLFYFLHPTAKKDLIAAQQTLLSTAFTK